MKYNTRYKPVGWRNESVRHSLAAKGVKTSFAKIKTKCNWQDRIPGGVGDKKTPRDFDPVQLAKGIKVEMEHTTDKKIATEIAIDHLTESPNYYKELAKMETTLEKKKSMAGKTVDFGNDTEYKRFKKAYLKAKENDKEQFDFDGQPVLVTYAKYMLEYAEDLRKKRGLSIIL